MNNVNFVAVHHTNKFKNSLVNNWISFKNYMYNKETREVIGRDGMSWAKISLFYFVFYSILASLFVGLVAVFVATLDRQVPTYYAKSSVMDNRIDLNPGLGYRPQIDPEDTLISYKLNLTDEHYVVQNRSLSIYLDKYFDSKTSEKLIQNCDNYDLKDLRILFKTNNSACDYNYHLVLDKTSCDPKKDFGYINGPCVAVKLNKIYSWLPAPYESLPNNFNTSQFAFLSQGKLFLNHILINCAGEYGTDRDNLKNASIVYFSPINPDNHIHNIGLIPFYYYPYMNQPEYRQPLVFVHFKKIPTNVLINIVCRAYANNIDSVDKQNLRGMTKFQLFIRS
jgi:sodium/potassium-transporting ATPase subunit beta